MNCLEMLCTLKRHRNLWAQRYDWQVWSFWQLCWQRYFCNINIWRELSVLDSFLALGWCQNKLVRTANNAALCCCHAATPKRRWQLRACREEGSSSSQSQTETLHFGCFPVVKQAQIDSKSWELRVQWTRLEFSALLYIQHLHAGTLDCQSYRFVVTLCCLHMPVLGVVVPSPWDDMKASRQIQQV